MALTREQLDAIRLTTQSATPFQPQRFEGRGAHTDQQWWRDLNSMVGQRLGSWQTETINEAAQAPANAESGPAGPGRQYTRRYIDTQWGRIYDLALDEFNKRQLSGNTEGMTPGHDPLNSFQGSGVRLGEYFNESGSDAVELAIDAEGRLSGVRMDRESNADMNTWLAIMATVGAAGYAGIGAGAAGGGAGEAGAAAGGLGFADAAQIALAAASVYGASKAGENGTGTTSVEPGDPTIEGPTPPPQAPMIDYADLAQRYGGPRAETKNRTNLNPAGVGNMLAASGNLLLGA